MPGLLQRFAALLAVQASLCLGEPHAQIAASSAESIRSTVAAADTRAPDLARASNLIVRHTDQLRDAQGSSPTTANAQLTRAAQSFAEFMARTDQYGHEADGSTPAARAKQQGYNFCMVSENIAFQFHSAGFATDELALRFVEGWKNSPGHRKNMLDPDAMETGTAVARSPRTGRYYAVQMFGRPHSAMFKFQIANTSAGAVQYQFGGRTFELPVRATRTHEQCRPSPLTVQGASENGTAVVQPGHGDRFTIVHDRQGVRLLKQ